VDLNRARRIEVFDIADVQLVVRQMLNCRATTVNKLVNYSVFLIHALYYFIGKP
jgi:hypothetical protein